jgi:ubiquitin-conjugating enzyme E2 Z
MASGDRAWDPLNEPLPAGTSIPRQTMARIQKDLTHIGEHPLHGILVAPDETSVLRVHALVIGAEGTPYAHGFFHFVFGFPPDYPAAPPRVRLLTTGGGTVRMNANLYASGKCCLSILGTWQGDPWSPAMSLSTVLLSIQSLILNAEPYRNEPGFENTTDVGAVKRYSEIITHEVIRVAVIDNVQRALAHCRTATAADSAASGSTDPSASTSGTSAEASSGGSGAATGAGAAGGAPPSTSLARSGSSMSGAVPQLPRALQEAMLAMFVGLSDEYVATCDALAPRLDGTDYEDPFWRGRPAKFAFGAMKARIADVLLPEALEVVETLDSGDAAEADAEGL